ncbi:MAG: hypothetical protein ACTS5P_01515 [Candidatus Hodgkinia cicadicola]
MIDAYFGKSLSIWRLSRRSEQTDESAGLMRLSRSKKNNWTELARKLVETGTNVGHWTFVLRYYLIESA